MIDGLTNARLKTTRLPALRGFKLFDLVERVWWFHNQAEKESKAASKRGDEFAWDDLNVIADDLLPRWKKVLAQKLLDAVVRGDVRTLRQTAATVEQLRDYETSKRHALKGDPLGSALWRFYVKRTASGDTKPPTIAELIAWATAQKVASHYRSDNAIRSKCKTLGLRIAGSKSGRKKLMKST